MSDNNRNRNYYGRRINQRREFINQLRIHENTVNTVNSLNSIPLPFEQINNATRIFLNNNGKSVITIRRHLLTANNSCSNFTELYDQIMKINLYLKDKLVQIMED